MTRSRRLAFALWVLVASLPAASSRAGPRPYAFLFGPDLTPPGGLEVQTWIGDEVPRVGPGSWDLWLGPDVGVIEGVEAGFFAIVAQSAPGPGTSFAATIDSLRLHGTLALAKKGEWPVDLRLRAEYGIPIGSSLSTAWVTAIASRDFGPLNFDANLGVAFAFASEIASYALYAVGASYEVFTGVRWGLEFNGASFLSLSITHLFVGPTLAIVQKRFWVVASIGPGFGGQSPNYHGRLAVGLNL